MSEHTYACFADIFRLYAPNAPYSLRELQKVFVALLQTLAELANCVNDPYYSIRFYTLESLATVKSTLIVLDFPNADEVLQDIFTTLLGSVQQNQPADVHECITDILIQLVVESPNLPPSVIDALVEYFVASKHKENPTATRIVHHLFSNANDYLQRYIGQYFTDVINDCLPQEGNSEMTDVKLNDLRATHDIIQNIHSEFPAVLINVIPKLVEELDR